MKLTTRMGAAALAMLAGAVIIAGCGDDATGSGGSGQALDLIPKNAVGYATVDLDFDSDSWKQFDELAGAFDAEYDRDRLLAGLVDSKSTDWEKDIEPWLGDSAGAAVKSVDADVVFDEDNKDGEGIEAFAWVDLKDRAKFESFLEKDGYTEDGSVGDYEAWKSKGGTSYVAVSDELALTGTSKADLEKVVEFDGDSITDAEGMDDVTDELDEDALVSVVVNGAGVRSAVDKSEDADQFGDTKSLDEFDGAIMQLTTEDKGARVRTVAKGMDSEDPKSTDEVFNSLPANTVVGFGGQDLGGALEQGLDTLAKNQRFGGLVTQVGALLGVNQEQIGEAFDGEFALALSGTDQGLQTLVSTVVGAVVAKSPKGVNPAALGKSAAITLAFGKGETSAQTLEKMVVGGSRLAKAPTPKAGTVGDFQTKTTTVLGVPLTVASSDDVAALAVGVDVFTAWGDDELGDNETFTSAWEASGAPDDAAGSMWVDYPRIAKLVELTSAEGVTPGGWVGWGEHDGDTTSFDIFMHVEK